MLNCFKISVSNIKRAKTFHETIFRINMDVQDMMGMIMAYFPADGMNVKISTDQYFEKTPERIVLSNIKTHCMEAFHSRQKKLSRSYDFQEKYQSDVYL